MARRARKIQVTAIPSALSDGEAALRAARAASILLRIAARIDDDNKNENPAALVREDEARRGERFQHGFYHEPEQTG